MDQTTAPQPEQGYGYAGLFTDEHRAKVRQAYPVFYADEPYTDVVITAGGTQEPIDNVRYVGNFSSGRFGHALAHEYASYGHNVTLVAPNSVIERFGKQESITHIPFSSAESLRAAMLGIKSADLILHAAAVADYTPVKVDGKISSDQDHLVVDMVRTPKILPLLRGHYGDKATIVGFKLLNGVSVEHLTEVAANQIAQNNTNYSVANLLEHINGAKQEREVRLVGADGSIQAFDGTTASVASGLYKAIRWTSRRRAFYA